MGQKTLPEHTATLYELWAQAPYRVFAFAPTRNRRLEFGTGQRASAIAKANEIARRATNRSRRYRSRGENCYNHSAICNRIVSKVTVVDQDGIVILSLPIDGAMVYQDEHETQGFKAGHDDVVDRILGLIASDSQQHSGAKVFLAPQHLNDDGKRRLQVDDVSIETRVAVDSVDVDILFVSVPVTLTNSDFDVVERALHSLGIAYYVIIKYGDAFVASWTPRKCAACGVTPVPSDLPSAESIVVAMREAVAA